MMTVRFFDRHTGIAGPGVPLPSEAAEIAIRYEDTEGDPAAIVCELQKAFPTGRVRDVPPRADLGQAGFGMITLDRPATGYPRNCWRVLKYLPVD